MSILSSNKHTYDPSLGTTILTIKSNPQHNTFINIIKRNNFIRVGSDIYNTYILHIM